MRRNDPRETLMRYSKRMPNGCLEWQGAKDKNGYGKVRLHDRDMRAHRAAYETFRGPIPAGLVLDHLVCDNPSCIDWWHTEPRTNRENILRGVGAAATNARKTHCVHGHPLSGANLYEWQRPDGGWNRQCKECIRRVSREHKRRLRAA